MRSKMGCRNPYQWIHYHIDFFEWYFKNINTQIHIVSNNLFCNSLIGDNNFGPFASNALINAISASTVLKGAFVLEYKLFKNLARLQIFDEIKELRITSVQTLLLSIIEMKDGNESQASIFIAMACSLSNYLGLHIRLDHLVENKTMSEKKLKLRQLLFWNCFVIDRIRCRILGRHPYLNVSDISITLPVQLNDEGSEIFREFCFLLDMQDNTTAKLYSLKMKSDKGETNLQNKKLHLSEFEMVVEKWKRRLPASCRFERKININRPTFLLSICYETFNY